MISLSGWKLLNANVRQKKVRDTKVIENFLKDTYKKITEMSLFRLVKKEVNSGAHGTQDYIIKKGPNKDKVAKKWEKQY